MYNKMGCIFHCIYYIDITYVYLSVCPSVYVSIYLCCFQSSLSGEAFQLFSFGLKGYYPSQFGDLPFQTHLCAGDPPSRTTRNWKTASLTLVTKAWFTVNIPVQPKGVAWAEVQALCRPFKFFYTKLGKLCIRSFFQNSHKCKMWLYSVAFKFLITAKRGPNPIIPSPTNL